MRDAVENLARTIDHALLAPALGERELEAGCRLAIHYHVASVCVVPYFLPRCVEILRGSGVKATTTVGFPHGANATRIKLAEAEQALDEGAEELDVVVNIGKVVGGDFGYVRGELSLLVQAVHARARKIKVIFENAYLDEAQKIALCRICGELGVDWAKTSTGFGPSAATVEDVLLMRRNCPRQVEIKASGGIKDLAGALAMQRAGATRIGTSRTREILEAYAGG
jgi:deoxyribose-phosphate aldolase